MSVDLLSARELEVVTLFVVEDMASKQVARALGLSHETVKSYLKRAREKLGARTKVALYKAVTE